jgi:hypothetical protein
MSFTYRAAGTDADRIRFVCGDYTIAPGGVLPAGANFSDREVADALTLCSTWQAAAVFLLRAAATQWSLQATSKSIGDFSFSRATAERLEAQADKLAANLPGAWSGMGLGTSTAKNPVTIE